MLSWSESGLSQYRVKFESTQISWIGLGLNRRLNQLGTELMMSVLAQVSTVGSALESARVDSIRVGSCVASGSGYLS